MSSKENNSGLMSSAGLVRYFDSESSKAIFLDPRTVAAIGAIGGIVGLLANLLF